MLRISAFCSPMVAVQAFEIAWRVYLPASLVAGTGLSLAAAGGLLLALRLFDSVIDPAIAWLSDLVPTRFGHRRPWLVLGLVPLLLGMPGVFFGFARGSTAGFVCSALLMHLGYMMIVTPYGGWALELGRTGAERLRLIAGKTWFGILGLIPILAFPAILERISGIDRAGQLGVLGLLAAVLFPLTVLLALLSASEPARPAHPKGRSRNPLRLFATIAAIPALWPVLALYLCSGIAEAASSAIFLPFVGDALGLKDWGSTLILFQATMSLLTLPFWTIVSSVSLKNPLHPASPARPAPSP